MEVPQYCASGPAEAHRSPAQVPMRRNEPRLNRRRVFVAWGEPRSNSTNYYYGIVNPTGGNPNDVDLTRAPTVAYSQEFPLKSGHRVPISAWA